MLVPHRHGSCGCADAGNGSNRPRPGGDVRANRSGTAPWYARARPNSRTRHRLLRPDRAAPDFAALRMDHLDAQAWMAQHRRGTSPGASGCARRLRHRRERGGARRAPLGQGSRARGFRLCDGRNRRGRRIVRKRCARAWISSSRARAHPRGPARGRHLAGCMQLPWRLRGGTRVRTRHRRACRYACAFNLARPMRSGTASFTRSPSSFTRWFWRQHRDEYYWAAA